MKKTLFLLLAFIMLAAGVYFLTKKESGQISTIKTDDRNFVVKDLSQVGKIFIADRTGFATTLERKGKEWLLDGKYKARENAINNLLTTISTIEIKYIPPNSAIPNIVDGLAVHGIKVEIYDTGGALMRTYYVGGVTNDERATYMLMEGAEQPYAMHMPLMEGALRARYRLDIMDWRDRAVFGYDADEIDYVSVEYPKQKNKSFILERKDNTFEVSPFYSSSPRSNKPYRKGSAETYLMGFKKTDAEAFENDHPRRDTIAAMIPFAIVTVKDSKGVTKAAQFHSKRARDANGLLIPNSEASLKSTIERYHIVHSSGDLMLGQHLVLGKLFWSYESFFKE